MTGVADMICGKEDEDRVLYEIKTCSNADWKEDAFTQAALYMGMTQHRRGVIRLLNPFRKEMHEYNISLLSKEKQVLTHVDRELLLWNFNCFLAKFKENVLMPPLPGDIQNYMCAHDHIGLEFVASTKARLVETGHIPGKTVVRPDPTDPLFQGGTGANFLTWLMETVGYQKETDQPDLSHDPFFSCVLLGVYLRKSYSFR
jgi:hypothetical protein